MAGMGWSDSTRRWLSLAVAAALACGVALAERPAQAGPFEVGVALFQRGHYRQALEQFLEAAFQAPRDPQRRWYLAETYRELGEPAAAAHEYRLILQQTPQDPAASAAQRALAALDEPARMRVEVAVQREGTAILIPARVNGEPIGAFILDTGATFMTLSRTAAERLGVSSSGASVRLITANGVVQAPLAVLNEVDVGGALAHLVPVVIQDLANAPPTIIGLLGLSFLERFRVNLDSSAGLLILEAGR
jgi:clan AA aspartic protease (TIGR02281 family)